MNENVKQLQGLAIGLFIFWVATFLSLMVVLHWRDELRAERDSLREELALYTKPKARIMNADGSQITPSQDTLDTTPTGSLMMGITPDGVFGVIGVDSRGRVYCSPDPLP